MPDKQKSKRDKIPGFIRVYSSHAIKDEPAFIVSPSGSVVRYNVHDEFGPRPVYFNLVEYDRYYGIDRKKLLAEEIVPCSQDATQAQGALANEIDVLDIGYINSDGVYVGPEEDFRRTSHIDQIISNRRVLIPPVVEANLDALYRLAHEKIEKARVDASSVPGAISMLDYAHAESIYRHGVRQCVDAVQATQELLGKRTEDVEAEPVYTEADAILALRRILNGRVSEEKHLKVIESVMGELEDIIPLIDRLTCGDINHKDLDGETLLAYLKAANHGISDRISRVDLQSWNEAELLKASQKVMTSINADNIKLNDIDAD